MKISPTLAKLTKIKISNWSSDKSKQTSAVDTFVGDIYSGLQATSWTKSDKDYAQNNLRIISGLYGILKPYDGVMPYRLEMGYLLKTDKFKNLYEFWDKKLARSLPEPDLIINLSADEYTKCILPYIKKELVISPRFLTINPKTKQPTFVVVHTKIARGAFANWLIKQKATETTDLTKFSDLGYKYDKNLSTPQEPVYVCDTFGGIGLSVRLK
jgi:cytoplasmic iron level regulating protein YaaA (DUF328/UPF0246 family)